MLKLKIKDVLKEPQNLITSDVNLDNLASNHPLFANYHTNNTFDFN